MPRIDHEEKGTGDPLVLIHGFCENRDIWRGLSSNLSGSFRLLIPDLPGFGRTPLLPGPFSIEDVALAMLEWLDQLGIERPVVVGHSLGGYVTLAMAAVQPARFSGFGLFHSTAYPDSDEKKANRNKVIDFVKRNGVKPFIETFVPGLFYQKNQSWMDEVYSIAIQTPAETLTAYAMAMRDRPSRISVLQEYDRPILMIAGEHDATIPYEHSSAQSQLVRFPFFSGLPNSGHMGMYENEPESTKIVRDFARMALEFEATSGHIS